MCFGDLVVLTVSGALLNISMVAAGYFTLLVAIGVVSGDNGRVIMEAYFECFCVAEAMGIVKLVRVVGVIMILI